METRPFGTAFSDPARLSIKFADLIGSIGGVALSSYAGGLAGKTELVKGMVKKSMLKRGASDAIANQVAEDTAKRWAQNLVLLLVSICPLVIPPIKPDNHMTK